MTFLDIPATKEEILKGFDKIIESYNNRCRRSCPQFKGPHMYLMFDDWDCNGECTQQRGHDNNCTCSLYTHPGSWTIGHPNWDSTYGGLFL